jgi:serine/threonine-protein kinase
MDEPMSLEAGYRLGRYEILEPLGAGGMGEVYRARDSELERDVAIKVLPDDVARDSSRLERFKREARAVAKLAHPNILEIWDFGREGDVIYSVTELLDGETLRARAIGVALGWRRAAGIGAGIADGLAAAHEAGIVHRDLKPTNVFITSDGRVKILDFGLAATIDPPEAEDTDSPTASRVTDPGTVLGTVGYMSPEQVRGRPVDHRTDIFALGCILYEIVSGRRAFAGDTSADTMAAILTEDPAELSSADAVLPAELERTIERCLEKRPQGRFQSASDLAFALRSLMSTAERTPSDRRGARARAEDTTPSIAVLPFSDMSPDRDQDYFCEGLAEEIINGLAQVDDLRVVARTSAFAFKDRREDIREIGSALDVGTVLEGSIRKAGSRLRITVQLIDAADGYHLWSQRFDREMDDVFEIQDEISLAVVDSLEVKLFAPERARLVKRHTESPDALNFYLQGRHFWNRRDNVGYETALDYFERAIKTDLTYALPHVGIADTFVQLGFYGFTPPGEAFERARAAARTALEIDDTIGEAHVSLAAVHLYFDWDWAAAEAEFRRAIVLSPSYALAHHWYGALLGVIGRMDEAIERIKHAEQLDPVSPAISGHAGLVLWGAQRNDEAIEHLRRAIELDPSFVLAHTSLAFVHQAKGLEEEALESARTAESLAGDTPHTLGDVGWVYGVTGRTDDALRILERLEKLEAERYVSPMPKGWVYLGLGRMNDYFEQVDRALLVRDAWLVFTRWSPQVNSVRSHPRFQDLLKRIGFPED